MIFLGFIFFCALGMLSLGVGDMLTGPDPLWLSGFFTAAAFVLSVLSVRIIHEWRK